MKQTQSTHRRVRLSPAGMLAALAMSAVLAGCTVTPNELAKEEIAANAADLQARVTANQEPVAGKITLYDAMARALKYNLDYRSEIYARALADAKLNLARADMLPGLVGNAHDSNRDNEPHSFSETLSGLRSVEPSTSRENHTTAGDLTFSWHILDFGLSYIRARQAADRSLIAEEQKRKVINRIMEDVRTAYWRAVTADRLLAGFHRLEGRTRFALENSRRLQREGFTSPLAALTYQRELVDIRRRIATMTRELATAKVQLAALMNLDPSAQYALVVPERKLASLELKIDPRDMVRLALENRPELREVAYKARINRQEAEAALLELLPGVQLYAGWNFDTNDFLLNNHWLGWGAKASWNLMRLFTYPVKKQTVAAEAELIDAQALATTMAVMTQVEVARLRYQYLRRAAGIARDYHSIQAQILGQVRTSASVEVAPEQSLIREEMNTLVASAEYDVAYADLQNAFAAIYSSVGVDPWGGDLDLGTDVATLSARLRSVWRERGDLVN
jgi:outer membrane protein TolC